MNKKIMKQEDKDLLVKDLSARLLYGVKLKPIGLTHTIISYATLIGISKDDNGNYHFEINDRDIDGNKLSYGSFKLGRSVITYLPYLRSMSTMTEEEEIEYDATFDTIYVNGHYDSVMTSKSYDWLNAHHFDYRGLIPKGLAIEAPERMYN